MHVACKEIITLEKQVLVIMLLGKRLLGTGKKALVSIFRIHFLNLNCMILSTDEAS